MSYSDCPQVELLTQRLVNAYREMSESEIESGEVVNDLHIAIMDHKARCVLCRRILMRQTGSVMGGQRVA